MTRRAVCLAAGLCAFLAAGRLGAAETRSYELSVVVDGWVVPEYAARNRTYIEALRGKSFSLRLCNPTPEAVAVALSVDGLNVVDAKRGSAREATKWVLWPGQVLEVPGWQISGATARRFFFTETGRSYAKWIGDTRNVGTIEAVFFRQKRSPIAFAAPVSPGDRPADERRREAAPPPRSGDALHKARPRDPDGYAATGAGERTSFPVQWIDFEEEPNPVARITLRYEYRPELVRLGVLSPREDLYARERGRGFKGEYAPDPGPER